MYQGDHYAQPVPLASVACALGVSRRLRLQANENQGPA
jgi:hypothetical protein